MFSQGFTRTPKRGSFLTLCLRDAPLSLMVTARHISQLSTCNIFFTPFQSDIPLTFRILTISSEKLKTSKSL